MEWLMPWYLTEMVEAVMTNGGHSVDWILFIRQFS